MKVNPDLFGYVALEILTEEAIEVLKEKIQIDLIVGLDDVIAEGPDNHEWSYGNNSIRSRLRTLKFGYGALRSSRATTVRVICQPGFNEMGDRLARGLNLAFSRLRRSFDFRVDAV